MYPIQTPIISDYPFNLLVVLTVNNNYIALVLILPKDECLSNQKNRNRFGVNLNHVVSRFFVRHLAVSQQVTSTLGLDRYWFTNEKILEPVLACTPPEWSGKATNLQVSTLFRTYLPLISVPLLPLVIVSTIVCLNCYILVVRVDFLSLLLLTKMRALYCHSLSTPARVSTRLKLLGNVCSTKPILINANKSDHRRHRWITSRGFSQ